MADLTSLQALFARAFDGTNLNITRVGAAPTWTAASRSEVDGILEDVFDPATGTIRVVEV